MSVETTLEQTSENNLEQAITGLDDRFITEAYEYSSKIRPSRILPFPRQRIAAAAVLFLCIGSISVFAANRLLKDTSIGHNVIYTGDHVPDVPDEENTITLLPDTDSADTSASDTWLDRKVWTSPAGDRQVSCYFSDHGSAVSYIHEIDHFHGLPGDVQEASASTFTLATAHGTPACCYLLTKCQLPSGHYQISEAYIYMDVADGSGLAADLYDPCNTREYRNAQGITLTLTDGYNEPESERTDNDQVTMVLIDLNNYGASLTFWDMTDDQIHQVLDCFSIPD